MGLYNTDGETVTQGITGLAERCKKYYARGARFAKWRAVCHIKDSGAPTQLAIDHAASDPREGKWFGHARQIRRRCQWQCRCQRLPTRGRLCLLRAQSSHERSALFPNSRIQLFTFLVICQDLICQDFFPLRKIV